MSNTPALLDQLHDWIVAWDPMGKTSAEFGNELRATHAKLEGRVDRDELTAKEVEAYGVLMSMADVRCSKLLPSARNSERTDHLHEIVTPPKGRSWP